ncbi:hypothetical protein TRVL_02210 [Trypanosoma vivax]|nr:hypothetical protein TRVL_02210 [Trypanosoma vivax]
MVKTKRHPVEAEAQHRPKPPARLSPTQRPLSVTEAPSLSGPLTGSRPLLLQPPDGYGKMTGTHGAAPLLVASKKGDRVDVAKGPPQSALKAAAAGRDACTTSGSAGNVTTSDCVSAELCGPTSQSAQLNASILCWRSSCSIEPIASTTNVSTTSSSRSAASVMKTFGFNGAVLYDSALLPVYPDSLLSISISPPSSLFVTARSQCRFSVPDCAHSCLYLPSEICAGDSMCEEIDVELESCIEDEERTHCVKRVPRVSPLSLNALEENRSCTVWREPRARRRAGLVCNLGMRRTGAKNVFSRSIRHPLRWQPPSLRTGRTSEVTSSVSSADVPRIVDFYMVVEHPRDEKLLQCN